MQVMVAAPHELFFGWIVTHPEIEFFLRRQPSR
jgi:hypothetical protein